MKDVRDKDPYIGQLNATSLPTHTILGIPDVLSAKFRNEFFNLATERADAFANLKNWKDLTFTTTVDIYTEDAVQKTCSAVDDGNIVDLAYCYLSAIGKSPKPRIQPVQGTAPSRPNAWTDGSYRNPEFKLGVGSYGLWHPDRPTSDLSPEECDFASIVSPDKHKLHNGLMLAGVLPSVFNSSTRTELAALIAICACPRPIHIGIDNATVVERANQLASGTYTRRRAWDLIPDGDLWQIAEECIAARGKGTTICSWHKSHATWAQLANGIVKGPAAVQNSRADLAADLGVVEQGWDRVQTAFDYIAAKQKAYLDIITRIQRMMIALLKEDAERRKQNGDNAHGKCAPVISIPILMPDPRPDYSDGIALDFQDLPPMLIEAQDELLSFWQTTRWSPCCNSQHRPTTWLEIFAIFRLWGGGASNFSNEYIPIKVPSFKSSLDNFIKDSRQILRGNLQDHSLPLLAPDQPRRFLLSH